MSIVERTDSPGHLRLVPDLQTEPLVVVPEAGEPDAPRRLGRCLTCTAWVMPCATCEETLHNEALAWLKDLADDHFKLDQVFSLLDLLASDQPDPDVQFLWRDPQGVTRLYEEPQPHRAT